MIRQLLFGVLLALVLEVKANLPVLGWRVQRNGRTISKFGDTTNGTKHHVADQYCWHRGWKICNLEFFIKKGDAGLHYQILGGQTTSFDKHRYCKTKKWGNTNEGQKVRLMAGSAWVSCFKKYGKEYTYLFVKKSTAPPFLQGFSRQNLNYYWKERTKEVITGSSRDADKIKVSLHSTWTKHWGKWSFQQLSFFMAKTILINYSPKYEEKKIIGISDTTAKSRIIVNDGCGDEYVEGMSGKISSAMSLTSTTRSHWEKTWQFGFNLSATGKGSKGADKGVEVSVTAGLTFGWSTAKGMSKEKVKRTASNYSWPHHCTPGYRYDIMKGINRIEIPVEFTFRRGDTTFKRRNQLITTAESWHEKKKSTKLASRPNGCK